MNILFVEAASLEEARNSVRAQLPTGLKWLREVVTLDGKGAIETVQAKGSSIEVAYSLAHAKVPDGNLIVQEEILRRSGWLLGLGKALVRVRHKPKARIYALIGDDDEPKKAIAHEWARWWWTEAPPDRTSANCDRCNGTIARGEGFLCRSSGGLVGLPDYILKSPDLLCESCFAEGGTEPLGGVP